MGVELFGSFTCPANWFAFTHTVDAQASHDAGINEHDSPFEQLGQLGVVLGHSTHRRSSVFRTSRAANTFLASIVAERDRKCLPFSAIAGIQYANRFSLQVK